MSSNVLFLESNDETSFFEVKSSDGSKSYDVLYDVDHHWLCTCPDYYYRKHFCKHMRQCAAEAGITDERVYDEVKNGGNQN